MKFNKNEEAVSPVIGVILMVAITVILAAVIAVFVFGMADDIQTSKTVAVTAKITGENVTVTYQGGPDANKVKDMTVFLYDKAAKVKKTMTLDTVVGSTNSTEKNTATRVVVVANFTDSTSQVLLDKEI